MCSRTRIRRAARRQSRHGFPQPRLRQAAYRNFGPVQLEDQLTVVDAALVQAPQLDPKRLAGGMELGRHLTLMR